MLQVMIFRESGEFTQTQNLVMLKDALEKHELVWVDLEEPSNEELDILDSIFNFHPLAIEDVMEQVGFPKIDVFDRYVFLVLHRIFYHFETETCEPREFAVFFSDRFIVTIHKAHLQRTFTAARDKVRETPRETLGKGTSYVLLDLLELAIKDHEPIIEQWEDNLEEIEQEVLRGVQDDILDQILQFKKLVATMRKSLIPEREVLKLLYKKTSLPYISEEAQPYFKSVIDDMNILLQELESLKDHATSVFDVYAAMLTIKMTESSNRLNLVMQRLTIIATIFLPLTFLVGVYGMNFNYMPEFHWKGFYFILWGIMIGIALSMVFYFRKKKWI